MARMKRIVSLAVVLACGGATEHARTVTIGTTSAASASPPLAPPDLCARIRTQQRAFVRAAIAKSVKEDPNAWTRERETIVEHFATEGTETLGTACLPFPNGVWSIELKTFKPVPDYGSEAEVVAVAYVGDRRLESDLTMPSGTMFADVHSQLASDYDKDGVPELWMHSHRRGRDGGHREEGRLLHATKDAVVVYAPTEKLGLIGAPRDVDGDGTMDLPVSFDIALGRGVVCDSQSDWSAAKFLAHALPDGTFSTTDAVAKSFTSSWCASPPSKVASVEQAFCARMWKLPRTLVSSSCAVWDCQLEIAGKPQPKKNATRDCEDRLDAYGAAVPFTLP
jgi:hypothetical protein